VIGSETLVSPEVWILAKDSGRVHPQLMIVARDEHIGYTSHIIQRNLG